MRPRRLHYNQRINRLFAEIFRCTCLCNDTSQIVFEFLNSICLIKLDMSDRPTQSMQQFSSYQRRVSDQVGDLLREFDLHDDYSLYRYRLLIGRGLRPITFLSSYPENTLLGDVIYHHSVDVYSAANTRQRGRLENPPQLMIIRQLELLNRNDILAAYSGKVFDIYV